MRAGPKSAPRGGPAAAEQGLPASAADTTHAEANYWAKRIQDKTLLLVRFRDGEELQGRLAWYDRSALRLDLPDGAGHRILRKQALATVVEVETTE